MCHNTKQSPRTIHLLCLLLLVIASLMVLMSWSTLPSHTASYHPPLVKDSKPNDQPNSNATTNNKSQNFSSVFTKHSLEKQKIGGETYNNWPIDFGVGYNPVAQESHIEKFPPILGDTQSFITNEYTFDD